MDERLEKALEFANNRITLGNQKRNIRSRMEVLQAVHYNSGSFIANPTTISFINTLIQLGKKTAVVIDTKDNPIEIDDLKEFQNSLVDAYYNASNEYKVQMDKVKKSRNIKKIMDW